MRNRRAGLETQAGPLLFEDRRKCRRAKHTDGRGGLVFRAARGMSAPAPSVEPTGIGPAVIVMCTIDEGGRITVA